MKEEIKELPKGQYRIPEGMVAVVSKGIVTVRENRTPVITGYRCRDCIHYALGHTTSSHYMSNVCLMKPKEAPKKHPGTQLYYSAVPCGKTCEHFELKG